MNKERVQNSPLVGIVLVLIFLLLIAQCQDSSSNGNPNNDNLILCQVECKEKSNQSDYFDKKRCLHQCEQVWGKFKL